MKRTKTFLLKITLHTFLCWTLALWQVIPSTAYADSTLEAAATQTNVQGANGASTAASGEQNGASVNRRSQNAEGNVTALKGESGDVQQKMLFSNIALFMSGVLAPALVRGCLGNVPTSVTIFAVSAGVYIANEIGLFTGHSKTTNRAMVAYKGRDDEQKQIDSLETAADLTRKAQKAAEKRAKFAGYAATGFLAAAALATYNTFWGEEAIECDVSTLGAFMTKPKEKLSPMAPGPKEIAYDSFLQADDLYGFSGEFSLYKKEENWFTNQVAELDMDTTLKNTSRGKINVNGLAYKFMTAIAAEAHAAGSNETFDMDSADVEGLVEGKDGFKPGSTNTTTATTDSTAGLPSINEQHQEFQNSVDQTASGSSNTTTSTSTATAKPKKKSGITVNQTTGKLAAAGIGLVAGAAMTSATPVLFPIVEAMAKPGGRALGFAAFALFAKKAADDTKDAANKLSKRAKEYDKLANALKQQSSDEIDNGPNAGNQYLDPTIQDFDNSTGGISNNGVCFQGGGASGVTPAKNCDCAKNNSCAKSEIEGISIPKFSGSALLANGLKDLGAIANKTFKDDLKGATTAGNSLQSKVARITRLRDALNKKANEDRVKAGKKPIDFEGAARNTASKIEKRLDRAFNNLTPAERATLARIGGLGPADDGDKEEKKDVAEESTGVQTGKVAAVDVNLGGGKGKGKTNSGGTWDFNFEDDAEKSAEDQQAIADALAAEEDENYQVDGDINDDRNKNLFNIITRRYLKSAYPVIFEER